MTETELKREIHHAFDAAGDKLLLQAKRIINRAIPEKPVHLDVNKAILEKAERLTALGFTKARENAHIQEVLAANYAMDLDYERRITEREKAVNDTKLITHYQKNYPFLKYISDEQLEQICNKYCLIHAPAAAYIGDIPEKNLIEIENAQELFLGDLPDGFFVKRISSWIGTQEVATSEFIDSHRFLNPEKVKVSEVVTYLKNRPSVVEIKPAKIDKYQKREERNRYFGGTQNLSQRTSGDVLRDAMRMSMMGMGYYSEGENSPNRASNLVDGQYDCPDRVPYYIAAPVSMFNMSDLIKIKGMGYQYVNPLVEDDPIVFMKCRGGALVVSKWGVEAGDQLLLNPINN